VWRPAKVNHDEQLQHGSIVTGIGAIQPGRVLAMVTRTTTGSPAGGPSRLHLLSFPPTSERSKTATMIRETRSVARRTIYDRATKRSLIPSRT
jgi:hypothetical protein